MHEDLSRVRHIDSFQDEHVVYQNDQYLCLMRLFPTCDQVSPPPTGDYRRFHIRFYIPRDCVIDARKKADRVVIMTNGLDEMAYYSLYDELGSRLASRGIVAVLLPLPDHLNRHPRYRKPKPSAAQIAETPSKILMKEPHMLYRDYQQFCGELSQLVTHVKAGRCADSAGFCDFYQQLFAKDARVSYVGYSLGAAGMLCAFLTHHSRLNACFLLNGATNLGDINPEPMFRKEEWQVFVKTIREHFRNKFRSGIPVDPRFEEVFLGQYIRETPEILKKHSRRLLFLFGGRDEMLGYDSLKRISPERWGLGMIVLPGINHFLAIDEEWKHWIELVISLLVSYEENAAHRIITELAIRNLGEDALVARKKGPILRDKSISVRARILGWDPERLAREEKKWGSIRKRTKSTPLAKLMIGEMLVAVRLVRHYNVDRALEIQKAEPPKTRRKLGKILADMGLVRYEDVETLVKSQTLRA